MLDKSFFITNEIHEKEVVLGDGSKHTLYFKELAAIDYSKFHIAQNSSDDDVKAGAIAKLIAASLCNLDGTPAITYEQALTLKADPMNAIFVAVMEVNRTSGKDQAEASGSGTS